MNRFSTLLILLVCLGASYTAALPVAADCAGQKSSSGFLDFLDPTGGALQRANCGGWTCSSTQDCVYCGNSFSCRPKGDTCCYPSFCPASQECILCGNFRNCYPDGSTCCDGTFGLICRPDQRCDWIAKRCVPR